MIFYVDHFLDKNLANGNQYSQSGMKWKNGAII